LEIATENSNERERYVDFLLAQKKDAIKLLKGIERQLAQERLNLKGENNDN